MARTACITRTNAADSAGSGRESHANASLHQNVRLHGSKWMSPQSHFFLPLPGVRQEGIVAGGWDGGGGEGRGDTPAPTMAFCPLRWRPQRCEARHCPHGGAYERGPFTSGRVENALPLEVSLREDFIFGASPFCFAGGPLGTRRVRRRISGSEMGLGPVECTAQPRVVPLRAVWRWPLPG